MTTECTSMIVIRGTPKSVGLLTLTLTLGLTLTLVLRCTLTTDIGLPFPTPYRTFEMSMSWYAA